MRTRAAQVLNHARNLPTVGDAIRAASTRRCSGRRSMAGVCSGECCSRKTFLPTAHRAVSTGSPAKLCARPSQRYEAMLGRQVAQTLFALASRIAQKLNEQSGLVKHPFHLANPTTSRPPLLAKTSCRGKRTTDSSGLISMTMTGCTFVLRCKLLLWAVILQHLAGSCRAWIDTSRAPTSARLCTDERSERLPCQLELADIAEFKPAAPTTGPGECTATDPVNVEAVLLPGNQSGVHSDGHAAMLEAVVHGFAMTSR